MYNTNSMLDFSKIFNIVFTSVCAALTLLFLISVIVVAAKGKRKCGVGDVLLRIVATLVLIASAAMVACSVLTMAKGSIAIVVAEDGSAAAFVMNKSITELPIPQLFAALSTVIGFGLSAILFILSLTALIVDCLVANKKTDKKDKKNKKEPAVRKSPEQLKREAELERIRRIGESAVRKTERVAEKAEKTEKPEKTEDKADDAIPTEQPQEEEPAVDWREQPKEEQHSGFVGLKEDNADDSFDSFDTFDDGETVEGDGTQDYEQAEGTSDDEYVAEDDSYEYADEQPAEEQADEYAEELTDEYAAENEGDAPTEDIYYDDDEGYTYDDGAAEGEEVYEQADGEPADDEYEVDEQPAEEYGEVADEQPIDIGEEVERILETPTDDIEPDRGIYIPEIRTVTPRPTEVKPTAAQKPVTQKPAAVKRPATKPAKPRKSGDGGASQRPVIPPEKKLPVTRRYVILDRHNAVNMFGEYLKERNQAEKDKLKSSINTIIIE